MKLPPMEVLKYPLTTGHFTLSRRHGLNTRRMDYFAHDTHVEARLQCTFQTQVIMVTEQNYKSEKCSVCQASLWNK